MRKGDQLNKFLVSGFDENYFQRFGVSWFASLKEISKFDGIVVLLAFNVKNTKILEILKNNNVIVIHKENIQDKRLAIFDTISELQIHSQGKYAYFDIDGYFSDEINSLYEMETNDYLLIANAANLGFCFGDNAAWNMFKDYRLFEKFFNFEHSSVDFLSLNKKISQIDSIWNCFEPYRLPEKTKIKFVHYSAAIKQTKNKFSEIDFSFENKYPEMYQKWNEIFYGHINPTIKNFLVRKQK